MRLIALLAIAPVLCATSALAEVDFAREVLPILSDKCFACHGPDAKKKDLRLDSFDAATADLGGYRAIDPDDLANSEIIHRIFDAEDPMPPEKAEQKLSDAERKILKQWVLQGGEYAKHWAFVPPTKPEPPQIKTKRGFLGLGKKQAVAPIDAFVGHRLQTADADFAPPADRRTLARRAALVLTGLPPTPAELNTFLEDAAEDAYAHYVDRLMAKPAYGEHQARYWLDAVRYGDTHGLHLDNRRGIYPYRDWVVRALNQNLPFDDFITWQLAGDLLPDPTLEQLVATGYVRMNPSTAEGGVIPAEFQAKNNFDRTENFGTIFLGMTMLCARCHTHKYDPITHTEYFELFAFFNSTAEGPLDGNKYEYKPTIKAPANQRDWQQWHQLTQLRQNLPDGTDPAELDKQIAELEKRFTTTLVAKELGKPRETKLLARGEYNLPTGEPLKPNTLSIIGALPDDAPRNRLGLAKWLVARDNPLTSRVLINRVWQRVFGEPIVRTPEDFGLQGQQPTHPELLDWLAVEFQDSEWDLKHMLKLMVTSRTFQQSSARRTDLEDPQNKLFSRGPRHRLAAEELRDVALWASGQLQPEMGGEGVKPYQPDGMWKALAHPASNTKQYVPDTGDKVNRRSLYVYWKRTSPHPMMTLFDAPSREVSCVRRSRSNTPLQSLGLFNEPQRVDAARAFAARLITAHDDDDARLDQAFARLASRPPTASERQTCTTLLDQMRTRYASSPEAAKALVGDTKLNPVEHAAWTQLTTTLLASDFAILLY